MEINEDKSPMEIALEFIEANPALIDKVEGDAFQAFWDHPKDVIALYKMHVDILSFHHCIQPDILETMYPDLLKDACNEYVNLNAIEP